MKKKSHKRGYIKFPLTLLSILHLPSGTVSETRILEVLFSSGSFNKFPDCFPMGTFIDSTDMKL